MANLVIGYQDRVPGGTVTASTQVGTLPAINMQHPALSPQKWRSTGNTASILLDMGATYSIGATALLGTNLTAAATWRIRLAATSALTSPTFDTGAVQVSAGVDPAYGAAIRIFGSSPSGRWLGIDLTDTSLAFLEVGRWWAGTAWQPARNYEFGIKRAWRDTTRQTLTEAGQAWVDRGVTARSWSLTLPAIQGTERDTHLETMGRVVGLREDVLVVLDPSSSNLGRDSLFGLLTEGIASQHRRVNAHAASFTIVERK